MVLVYIYFLYGNVLKCPPVPIDNFVDIRLTCKLYSHHYNVSNVNGEIISEVGSLTGTNYTPKKFVLLF